MGVVLDLDFCIRWVLSAEPSWSQNMTQKFSRRPKDVQVESKYFEIILLHKFWYLTRWRLQAKCRIFKSSSSLTRTRQQAFKGLFSHICTCCVDGYNNNLQQAEEQEASLIQTAALMFSGTLHFQAVWAKTPARFKKNHNEVHSAVNLNHLFMENIHGCQELNTTGLTGN